MAGPARLLTIITISPHFNVIAVPNNAITADEIAMTSFLKDIAFGLSRGFGQFFSERETARSALPGGASASPRVKN
jgi:hypothetical protein